MKRIRERSLSMEVGDGKVSRSGGGWRTFESNEARRPRNVKNTQIDPSYTSRANVGIWEIVPSSWILLERTPKTRTSGCQPSPPRISQSPAYQRPAHHLYKPDLLEIHRLRLDEALFLFHWVVAAYGPPPNLHNTLFDHFRTDFRRSGGLDSSG